MAGTPHFSAGTHSPFSCFKYPGLQKQPMTHCLVQIGAGCGLAQVGAQAEPHGMKTSFSLHCISGGKAKSIFLFCASQFSGRTHSPFSFFMKPGLQKQPMTHWSVQMVGFGLAHVGSQADPHVLNSPFGPQSGATKAVVRPMAKKLNSNAVAKRVYIAEA